MLKITETKLHAGLSAPVKILHITDIHLTFTNEKDLPEHQELMKRRVDVFREEASFPPHTPSEYFEEAIRYAKENNLLIVNTGDTMDIYSYGNIDEFRRIKGDNDMMFSPGGHEHQKDCSHRTMEIEYPYWETIRPKLCATFPEFDMDFSSRVVNGLNIICADNSLDYYSPATLARFKKEIERGLPIIVFSHDPLWDKILQYKEPYHPNVRLTPADYAASHEMMDLLKNHPLVLATFGGHSHSDGEMEINGKTHYMTAGLFKGICRKITID